MQQLVSLLYDIHYIYAALRRPGRRRDWAGRLDAPQAARVAADAMRARLLRAGYFARRLGALEISAYAATKMYRQNKPHFTMELHAIISNASFRPPPTSSGKHIRMLQTCLEGSQNVSPMLPR